MLLTLRTVMLAIIITMVLLTAVAAEEQRDQSQKISGVETEERFNFIDMRQDELMQIIDTLKAQVGVLKNNQKKYKKDINPEYGEIQNRVDRLERECVLAYKRWVERSQEGS